MKSAKPANPISDHMNKTLRISLKTSLLAALTMAVVPVFAAVENPSISDIVTEIERNNLRLDAIGAQNKAEVLEMRAENSLPATSIEYSPFFRSGVTGLASSELIVSQEFEFPTIYAARSKAADSRRDALEQKLCAERRTLRIAATQECLDLILSYRERDILMDRLATADTLIALYKRKLELGAATAIDVNKLLLSRQDLDRGLRENAIAADEIKGRLRVLNGGKPLDLDGLEYGSPLDDMTLPTDPAQYASQDPAVKAALAETRYAEKETGVANGSWLPSVSVGYRRNTEMDEASNGFMVGLSFPLFSIGKQSKAAEARKSAAMIEAENARIQSETEAEDAIRRLEAIRSALAAYDTSLIEENLRLYRRALDLGRISLTEYYVETDALYDRLLNRQRLEHDYRRLAASLQP